jgi:hypothetical protein
MVATLYQLVVVVGAAPVPLGLMAITTRKVGVAPKIAVLVGVGDEYFPEAAVLAV